MDMQRYDVEQQHRRGKLHAIERIAALTDEGSFREFGSNIRNQSEAFGLVRGSVPYDGVITGTGTMDGKPVVIYSQDFTVMAGTLGRMHGKKIARAIKTAIENRCPVIGISDSGGARIQEGADALAGYGEIFRYNTLASGYIPQISIIAGNCAGGAAYSPGITDFVFMVKDISNIYITGPRVVEAATHQKVDAREFGSAGMHRRSGVVHFCCENEEECYRTVRQLLSLIPHHCGEMPPCVPGCGSASGGPSPGDVLPGRGSEVYDVRDVIGRIADPGSFLEVHREFAGNLVVGFGRMDGRTVGFVANQPLCIGGALDSDGSVKGARFVRYCDCFDIPIVTLVDVPGFLPGLGEEERGIIRHGAKLLYAYAESTAPKLTVILRKAYGGAYIAMGSRHVGADFVYAWPGAEIAVMGEEGAVEILFRRELAGLEGAEREERRRERCEEYRRESVNARIALEGGYVDEILAPEETRDRLLSDLRFLGGKQVRTAVAKKHGNIPL